MVPQSRRSEGAEVVQVEAAAASLTPEAVPGAVLLAAHAGEEVGRIDSGEHVEEVAEVEEHSLVPLHDFSAEGR